MLSKLTLSARGGVSRSLRELSPEVEFAESISFNQVSIKKSSK